MLRAGFSAGRAQAAALLICMATLSPAAGFAQARRQSPPRPPPSDVRFKSRYSTGDGVTESVTSVRGSRERYELSDMILIRQHDQQRTVQISRAAKTYLVTHDAAESPAAPTPLPASTSAETPPGLVGVETSIVDTGERRTVFGLEARRVKTVIDRQPQSGACDPSKQRIETDGWYIDPPKALSSLPQATPVQSDTAGCRDRIEAKQNGDPALLGFPIGYTTTLTSDGGGPIVMTMEVTEFEVMELDGSLFEIPEGMTAATNARELAKAISDENEAQLAAGPGAAVVSVEKVAGTLRVAVPELRNGTTEEIDTRALRARLITALAEQNVEAVPLAAASQAEMDLRAAELGCDYLLLAQIVELKVSKPGRFRRVVNAAAREPGDKDLTEAKLDVELLPVGGGDARMTEDITGKDGGIGIGTGLRLVRVAASLYLRYASPLAALNAMQMMNLGGMDLLSDPALMQLQGGSGPMGSGGGGDRTAGAAMFLLEQAMAGASAPESGVAPSFDASLGEALESAAKKVMESLKK